MELWKFLEASSERKWNIFWSRRDVSGLEINSKFLECVFLVWAASLTEDSLHIRNFLILEPVCDESLLSFVVSAVVTSKSRHCGNTGWNTECPMKPYCGKMYFLWDRLYLLQVTFWIIDNRMKIKRTLVQECLKKFIILKSLSLIHSSEDWSVQQ